LWRLAANAFSQVAVTNPIDPSGVATRAVDVVTSSRPARVSLRPFAVVMAGADVFDPFKD
jgi:hypothetical protein